MKEWFLGAICAIVIMAACAMPWGRIGGSSTAGGSPSSEATATPTPPPKPDPEVKIQEVIERTQGDYTKLTPEEKMRLNDLAIGHGRGFFEIRVRQWKQKKHAGSPSGANPSPSAEGSGKIP